MTGPDAVGVGAPTLDELLLLDDYPAVGSERAIRVRTHSVQGGGPAATAMAAAARLGLRTGFVGKVGDDDRGRQIRAGLIDAGVDVSRLGVAAGGRSTLSVVCVHAATGERNFLIHADPDVGLAPDDLDRDYIAAAKVLLVDSFSPAALTAARWAKAAGRRVVLDAAGAPERGEGLDEFLALTDVLIGSRPFGAGFLGRDDPPAAAEALRRAGPDVAIVSAGADGAWVAAAGESFHQPACRVEVVDTTGAGDVFHGAFIVGLIESWPLPRTAAFASAAGAIICRTLGGRAGLPARNEVLRLMGQQR